MTTAGRRPAIQATDQAWKRLGELLQARRGEMGYRARPRFCEERNINERLITDIENTYRKTFKTPTLQQIAQAYAVTYHSIAAVLSGHADELEPAPPDGTRQPPVTDPAREDPCRPYADEIYMRLLQLGTPDVADLPGSHVFGGGTAEARMWDEPSLRRLWSVPERVWMIADLRRRKAQPR